MATTKWIIDGGHSQLQFKVKHLAIATVSGTFRNVKGEVESDGDEFDAAAVRFEMDAASLDTNNADRDGHLKSELFLNAGQYPNITFSGHLEKTGDEFKLVGDLTLLDTTKQVSLTVEHTGHGAGRFGEIRAGFDINGKIKRKDFGLNFNMATEAGNLIVGEEIKILGEIELIKQ